MSTPEGRVKARLKKILDGYRPQLYHHWPVQNGMGSPTLDCNGAINGRAFSIECKAPGQTPTERQFRTAEKMVAAGVRVFVYDGSAEREQEIVEFLLYWKMRAIAHLKSPPKPGHSEDRGRPIPPHASGPAAYYPPQDVAHKIGCPARDVRNAICMCGLESPPSEDSTERKL